MTLPIETMLWLARDMSDIAFAKFDRAVRRNPEEMSRVVLHADRADLRLDGWPHDSITALLKWRDERAQDKAEKRADRAAAAALHKAITQHKPESAT